MSTFQSTQYQYHTIGLNYEFKASRDLLKHTQKEDLNIKKYKIFKDVSTCVYVCKTRVRVFVFTFHVEKIYP